MAVSGGSDDAELHGGTRRHRPWGERVEAHQLPSGMAVVGVLGCRRVSVCLLRRGGNLFWLLPGTQSGTARSYPGSQVRIRRRYPVVAINVMLQFSSARHNGRLVDGR